MGGSLFWEGPKLSGRALHAEDSRFKSLVGQFCLKPQGATACSQMDQGDSNVQAVPRYVKIFSIRISRWADVVI